MTIIRVGTTQKYSDGWMSAFGGKKKAASNGTAKKTTAKGAKSAKASAKKSKAAPKKKARDNSADAMPTHRAWAWMGDSGTPPDLTGAANRPIYLKAHLSACFAGDDLSVMFR